MCVKLNSKPGPNVSFIKYDYEYRCPERGSENGRK